MEESLLARKLRFGARLGRPDVERLERMSLSSRSVRANTDLIREADPPYHVHVVQSGVACRYKLRPDGSRAIVALLLPGDFCDLHVSILGRMDHSIAALLDSEVTYVPEGEMLEMLETHPAIARACWWSTLVDEAILREWLVNVGRRPSEKQLGHLFCELYTRLHAVGLATDARFRMPFTHVVLGDLLGLSSVHIQRVLRSLRQNGLITLQDHWVGFPDFAAMAGFSEFDPGYLHMGERR